MLDDIGSGSLKRQAGLNGNRPEYAISAASLADVP
jgi:hypothetical protein